MINTHSHFDHAGGLRAFVAEGSTILTHESNKAYLEKVLSLPHTLNPDKAQASGRSRSWKAWVTEDPHGRDACAGTSSPEELPPP